MPWIQIIVDVPLNQAETLEDTLLGIGSVAVTLQDAADQPLYEPPLGSTPLWEHTRVMGLFEADTDIDLIKAALQNEFPALTNEQYRIDIVEDQAWERAWMENFKPIRCGNKLWVCPSWCDIPDKHAVNLLLDPGLAFGTGTHPTTHLCLSWLDEIDLKNKTLIDYGCGSGILAIAALLLGATHATAIDNDPQALIATYDNAQRNNINTQQLTIIYPREINNTLQTDVIIANILAQPLVALASTICSLLKQQGVIALSGILEEQAPSVMQAYATWITWQPMVCKDGWVRLSGSKR